MRPKSSSSILASASASDLLLILSGCLLFSAAARAEPALRQRESADRQRPAAEISLRPVLVPALVSRRSRSDGRSEESDEYHSINNRGVDFLSLTRTRFGQRTSALLERREGGHAAADEVAKGRVGRDEQRTGNRIVWSQPDPRKSYSAPVGLVKVYSNGALFRPAASQRTRNKLNIGETLKRSGSVQVNAAAATQDESPSATGGDLERENFVETSSRPMAWSGRHQQTAAADGGGMVTLIKYLPVLLSVPADSVIPLPAGSSQLISSSAAALAGRTQATHRLRPESPTTQAPPYFGLYKSHPASPIKLIKYHQATAEVPYKFGQISAAAASEDENQLAADQQQQQVDHHHHQPAAIAVIQQAAAAGSQGGSQAAPANEINSMLPTAASSAKFAYLPGPSLVAPAPFLHSQVVAGGSTSKALSAYASRLMSMLRPSTLLSSINANSQQPLVAYPQQQPAQIYLLAPAEGFTGAHVRVPQQPRPLVAAAAAVGQDSMINQASRLQQSTTTLALAAAADSLAGGRQSSKGTPTWMHQQPNGLICVHSVVQPQQQMVLSGKSGAAYNQPVLASPFESPTTTTVATPVQQLVDAAHDEQSSFDYAPRPQAVASTELPPPARSSTRGKGKQSQPRKKSTARDQSGGADSSLAGKDSPAKLAHKLNTKLRLKQKTPVAHHQFDSWDQQQQQQQQVEEAPIGQQKALASSSSSESRSSLLPDPSGGADLALISATATNSSTAEEPPFRASRRYGNGTTSPFIPFTIRDKIDLPAARRLVPTGGGGGPPSAASRDGTSSATNNPVIFDEPAEGEAELRESASASASAMGTAVDKQRFSWPPTWLDERRVRTTSFVSSLRSQQQRQLDKQTNSRPTSAPATNQPNKQIDYRRDAGSSTVSGYTLPLLIASSSAAGANQQPQQQRRRFSSQPPLVTRAASAAADSRRPQQEQAEMIRPAASQQLTASGSVLEQPAVTLAGGTAPDADLAPNQPVAARPSGRTAPAPAPTAQSAAESRLSSVLVAGRASSSPLAGDRNHRADHGAGSRTTVELVVDSSPDTFGRATTAAVAANESAPETTTTSPTTTTAEAAAAAAPNHAQPLSAANSFADSAAANSQWFEEDFGKISESLQTNPMDLIDLQNSRSSFELPSHLESLAMLSAPEKQQQLQLDMRAAAAELVSSAPPSYKQNDSLSRQ